MYTIGEKETDRDYFTSLCSAPGQEVKAGEKETERRISHLYIQLLARRGKEEIYSRE